ncbi:hypothetical protein B0H15DRAFT_955068 [Mycena belliarum]|uniref:F-box domain-containing protein n=1 Tax=Mycena belliarum TaxID=1033014 RepID=A0AAD6XGI9_9AGAR|nr:hypothetical protein B0H15DRAFT_955068 [Mycena belliae]
MPVSSVLPVTTATDVAALNLVVESTHPGTYNKKVRGIIIPTGANEPMWATVSVDVAPALLPEDIDYIPWIYFGVPTHLLPGLAVAFDVSRSSIKIKRSPTVIPVEEHDDWMEQLEFLTNAEDGPDLRRVLDTMAPQRLFATALVSEVLHKKIVTFITFISTSRVEEDSVESDVDSDTSVSSYTPSQPAMADLENGNGFRLLPPELGLQIFKELGVRERIYLAQTSRYTTALAAQDLQARATRLLSRFHLLFEEVRLMLSASAAIISGSTIPALLQSSPSFEPEDLDFFTKLGGGFEIVRYLTNTDRYHLSTFTAEYQHSIGIGRVWSLTDNEGTKINVVESLSNNPFDAVPPVL